MLDPEAFSIVGLRVQLKFSTGKASELLLLEVIVMSPGLFYASFRKRPAEISKQISFRPQAPYGSSSESVVPGFFYRHLADFSENFWKSQPAPCNLWQRGIKRRKEGDSDERDQP